MIERFIIEIKLFALCSEPVFNHTLNACGTTYITIGDGGNAEELNVTFVRGYSYLIQEIWCSVAFVGSCAMACMRIVLCKLRNCMDDMSEHWVSI